MRSRVAPAYRKLAEHIIMRGVGGISRPTSDKANALVAMRAAGLGRNSSPPHRHQRSGGAQGPDPEQALLQAGPPDAVQPPPTAAGVMTL
jgi:hypothetical protein